MRGYGEGVSGAVREWVTLVAPGKQRKRWQIDVTFMLSRYQCIFGCGCQGNLTEPAAEMAQGCCSYGAHAHDNADRKHVESVAKQLHDDEWQFKSIGEKRGVWATLGPDSWRTRLVDDACIFLNRPGFGAGPGCALHVLALRKGVHFSETKPTVCWQVPLRAIPRDEDDGSETTVLTEFGRDGWGEGGEDFAWWCTEAPEAFTGEVPVYVSMEKELRAICGDVVYDELAKYLGSRASSPSVVAHPAEVPVMMTRKRTRDLPHNFG
jgi:hypothetical protein